MEITKEIWGKTPCGKDILKYRMTNSSGAYVELSEIGAGIVTLHGTVLTDVPEQVKVLLHVTLPVNCSTVCPWHS